MKALLRLMILIGSVLNTYQSVNFCSAKELSVSSYDTSGMLDMTGDLLTHDQKNTQINKRHKKKSLELQELVDTHWYKTMVQNEQKKNSKQKSVQESSQKQEDFSEKTNDLQLTVDEKNEDYYYTLLYYGAFNAGFRFDDYWQNTSQCYYAMCNYTYIQKPLWDETMALQQYDAYFKIDNTTALISNTSNSLYYCTNMTRSWWDYVLEQQELFEYSWGAYLAGFFQNLLAEVISINNIYTSIEENQEIANTTGVWYDTGRLFRIIGIFDPIEPVDELSNSEVPVEDGQNAEFKIKNDWIHQTNQAIQSKIGRQTSLYKRHVTTKINKVKQKINQLFLDNYEPREAEDHEFGDLANITNSWDFTKGFLNSTGITYGGNRTGCEIAIIDIDSGLELSVRYLTEDWYDFINVLNSIDQVLLVGYSLNGITFDCYYGAEESYYISGNYSEVISDIDYLVYNLAYNLGQIYNESLMVYTFYNYPKLSVIKDYWDLGYYFGLIAQYMLYPTEDLIEEGGAGATVTDI